MRDELSVLSAFLVVAEERSFTRAAKQLNISTSGLSHAIRRLEEQIGVRLADADDAQRVADRCRRAVARAPEAGARGHPRNVDQLVRPADEADRTRAIACVRGLPRRPSWLRNSVSSRATTRTWSSTSRPMTAASTWCQPASTQASSSASTSRRTWWPSACRRIFGPRSSAHPRTSRTPQADGSARRAATSMHRVPSPRREQVPVGIRQRRPVDGDLGQRVAPRR